VEGGQGLWLTYLLSAAGESTVRDAWAGASLYGRERRRQLQWLLMNACMLGLRFDPSSLLAVALEG